MGVLNTIGGEVMFISMRRRSRGQRLQVSLSLLKMIFTLKIYNESSFIIFSVIGMNIKGYERMGYV